ncbi:MAG: NAD(P)-binding protein [Firmicutes bacterium]|nr:NAD(P)-binding protein [Bacillota bacterium]
MHDAVLIGSGHNNLVAGVLLAQAGWKVVVFEQADEVGGAVRTAELGPPEVEDRLRLVRAPHLEGRRGNCEGRHSPPELGCRRHVPGLQPGFCGVTCRENRSSSCPSPRWPTRAGLRKENTSCGLS